MKFNFSILLALFIASNMFADWNPENKMPNKLQPKTRNSLPPLRGNGLCFTPNKGQIADMDGKFCPNVLYKGDGGGANIYLRKTGISYVYSNMDKVMNEVNEQIEELEKDGIITKAIEKDKKQELIQKQILKMHRVDMDFANCNNNIVIGHEDEVDGYLNFYYAHCPQGVSNVNQYNKVTYKNIYNNIDVSFYGNKKNGLEYDIIVKPHADPNQIKLHWKGTENIHINNEGKLVIKTSVNEFYESMPKVYQVINGEVIDVKANYKLSPLSADHSDNEGGDPRRGNVITGEGLVTFELGIFNREFPLIIDPVAWITYYGGNNFDWGRSLATDKAGNPIFSGSTSSTNFPILGASQGIYGGAGIATWGDAFIVKMNSAGGRIFATYFGGSSDEIGTAINADGNNDIYLTGLTSSTNFPTKVWGGSFMQATNGGGAYDAFIVKFSVTGTLVWSTYYGGSNRDVGCDLITDGVNDIVFTGFTSSTNFPITSNPYQPVLLGSSDAFVVKLDNTGLRQWATYYGGSGDDFANGIALDGTNNIYVCGSTTSANFPVINPGGAFVQATGQQFLLKLDPAMGFPVWSTHYGSGNNFNGANDTGQSLIAIDLLGNVLLAFVTGGPPFGGGAPNATPGAQQTVFGGGSFDLALIKFDASGALLWGTYLGGSAMEALDGLALDGNNNIYIYGEWEDTDAGNYPISPCALQSLFGGGGTPPLYPAEDEFIAKYDPNGNQRCITYIGGNGEDDVEPFYGTSAMAIYGNFLFITGCTHGGYPVTPGAFQTSFNGGIYNAFVDKLCINICEAKALGLNYSASTTNVCINKPVTFTPTVSNTCDNSGQTFEWTFTGGNPSSSTAANPTVSYPTPGVYNVKLVLSTQCKKDSVIKSSYITVSSCGCVLTAAASVVSNINCSSSGNGTANVTINSGTGGPYTYNWSNGTSGTTTATTINLSGLAANTYTVTITEGLCVSISTVTFTQPISINSIAATNISCNGGNNGSATVTISGTGGPYTYSWSNGISSISNSQTNLITNLTAGTYTVTLTQGSCTSISSVLLSQPSPMSVAVSAKSSCSTNSITATAFPANGNSPYTYLWGNGQTTQTTTASTTYSIIVTDANGCSATGSAITINPPLNIIILSTNNSCTSTGGASVNFTSGSAPFSYSWSNGQTGSSIGGLVAGTYTVTVTDGNGCTSAKTVNITGVNPVTATFTYPQVCAGKPITFTNTGTAPGSGTTYFWTVFNSGGGLPIASGNTTNFSYTFLATGSYSITHTANSGGCNASVTSNITVINCTGPSVNATGGSVCPGSCTTLASTGSNGTSPYTYSWSNGGTTQNINPCPVSNTIYTVTIKDSGGNTATSTAIVSINPAVSISITATNITCNGSTNGNAIANAGSGTPPYNYSWSNGQTTQTATGLSAGNYTLTITDSKSCTATNNVAIVSPAVLSGQFTKGTANCAACGCKEWIIVNTTGGTSPYSYSWPDGYINRYKNQLCPGNYTVNIKDKNGCSINISVITP